MNVNKKIMDFRGKTLQAIDTKRASIIAVAMVVGMFMYSIGFIWSNAVGGLITIAILVYIYKRYKKCKKGVGDGCKSV